MRFACVPSGPSNRLAWGVALGCAILLMPAAGQTTQVQPETAPGIQPPSRVEVIAPKRKDSFNDRGTCPEKKQGGNPRLVSGYLVFDGATDGNRQVDPQLAVGGGYVLTGTNTGLIIYTKQGEFVQGASQACFNGGIDPKMFYDPHNKVFGFDLWYYWDKPQVKPINLSISETSDPRGAWNTYPIPSPNEVDGGGLDSAGSGLATRSLAVTRTPWLSAPPRRRRENRRRSSTSKGVSASPCSHRTRLTTSTSSGSSEATS